MRIVVMPPFDAEFFGTDRLEAAAGNLFVLVERPCITWAKRVPSGRGQLPDR